MDLLATWAYLFSICEFHFLQEHALESRSFPCSCTREEKVLNQLFFTDEDCIAKPCVRVHDYTALGSVLF